MAGKIEKKTDPAPTVATPATAPAVVRFRFARIVSGAYGYFAPGTVAELPREFAESLYLEGAGELL
jgi:hypothetical protein